MKPAAVVLVIVGLALAALGAYFGLASVDRLGTDCGSAFHGVNPSVAAKDQANADAANQAQMEQSMYRSLARLPEDATATATTIEVTRLADSCGPAVSDRRTVALLVLVPGAALALGGLVLMASATVRERE